MTIDICDILQILLKCSTCFTFRSLCLARTENHKISVEFLCHLLLSAIADFFYVSQGILPALQKV